MLSLILPTFNEAKNLPVMIPKIEETLQSVEHEIIIVDDDSPDNTWKVAQEMSEKMHNLHVIRRVGRHGLSSAVVEGFLAAKGDVLAVADADGQHDLSILPIMFAEVKSGSNIAIGSRYVEGGSAGDWEEDRQSISRFATALAMFVCKVDVRDPMSGFFAIDRETFEKTLSKLNPKGFKILLDFLVNAPKKTTVTEIPFVFGERIHGKSKLEFKVKVEFLEYLYDVTVGRFIPLTFLKYCIVGSLGIGVQWGTYYSVSRYILEAYNLTIVGFSIALLSAIEVAIFFNFILNNMWTFNHLKLRGMKAVGGFLKFNVACAVGAFANYAVAALIFSQGYREITAVVVGAIVGTFWNYTINRLVTWKG
ncbi:glycosyltransferase family 2 protein [Candidatus Peribacteria bacterium]|nr:glycosyltransferase family 2 protein [Candidatus Peribacteria bacterium]